MHTEPKPTFYDPLVNSKNSQKIVHPKMNSEMKENENYFFDQKGEFIVVCKATIITSY